MYTGITVPFVKKYIIWNTQISSLFLVLYDPWLVSESTVNTRPYYPYHYVTKKGQIVISLAIHDTCDWTIFNLIESIRLGKTQFYIKFRSPTPKNEMLSAQVTWNVWKFWFVTQNCSLENLSFTKQVNKKWSQFQTFQMFCTVTDL